MLILTAVTLILGMSLSHAEDTTRTVEGKCVVVTGGGRGIGLSTAEECLKKGASKVIIIDKKKEMCDHATWTLNYKYGSDKSECIYGDVTTDREELINKITTICEVVSIFVNNAGVLNENDYKLTVETNVLAPLELTRWMREKASKENGGEGAVIMNVGSICTHMGLPFVPGFKSSACAIQKIGEILGKNYDKTGVAVITVNIGLTRTALTDKQLDDDELDPALSALMEQLSWQTQEDAGVNMVEIYMNGESGKSYDLDGGSNYLSPEDTYYNNEYLTKLTNKN